MRDDPDSKRIEEEERKAEHDIYEYEAHTYPSEGNSQL